MCGAAAPSWGAGALEVSMSVLLGEGGEGVSLSYGEGGEGGTGERGAGMGLRLQLRTPDAGGIDVRVLYAGVEVFAARMARAPPRPALPGAERVEPNPTSFAPLLLAYGVSAHGGAAAGRRRTSDGTVLVARAADRWLGAAPAAGASRSAAAPATARPTYGCAGCACARALARARSRCR